MHRLRVAWTFFRIGLLNELAYRANLYLQVLQSGVAVVGAIGWAAGDVRPHRTACAAGARTRCWPCWECIC